MLALPIKKKGKLVISDLGKVLPSNYLLMLDGVQLNLGCYLDRDNIQNVVNHFTKIFLKCKCLDSSRATRDSFLGMLIRQFW